MWYLHFDKREIVLPLEICKMWVEKKKMGSQGNREMKDVENEELQQKPECLRIQQQRMGGRKKMDERKTNRIGCGKCREEKNIKNR